MKKLPHPLVAHVSFPVKDITEVRIQYFLYRSAAKIATFCVIYNKNILKLFNVVVLT